MGKGAELWDDSALINAFDAAMASYKEIHMESFTGHTHDKCKDENINEGNITVLSKEDENNSEESNAILAGDAKSGRMMVSEGSNHDLDNCMKEICGSSCSRSTAMNGPSTQPEDIGDNSVPSEVNALITDHPSVDPKLDGYSDHQILNYNELLKQYYELEQRKEKIAEQLWQANYWNYQTPAHCSASQEQHVPVSSGSELDPNISCTWCTCPCVTATSTPISACPMASALSVGYACCPQQMCRSGSVLQQKVEEKKGECDVSSIFKAKEISSTCPDTDLTSVLNAWYWAGFKTGRYLLKQEQAKLAKQ